MPQFIKNANLEINSYIKINKSGINRQKVLKKIVVLQPFSMFMYLSCYNYKKLRYNRFIIKLYNLF